MGYLTVWVVRKKSPLDLCTPLTKLGVGLGEGLGTWKAGRALNLIEGTMGLSKNRVYWYTPNGLAIECRENDVLIQWIFRQTPINSQDLWTASTKQAQRCGWWTSQHRLFRWINGTWTAGFSWVFMGDPCVNFEDRPLTFYESISRKTQENARWGCPSCELVYTVNEEVNKFQPSPVYGCKFLLSV